MALRACMGGGGSSQLGVADNTVLVSALPWSAGPEKGHRCPQQEWGREQPVGGCPTRQPLQGQLPGPGPLCRKALSLCPCDSWTLHLILGHHPTLEAGSLLSPTLTEVPQVRQDAWPHLGLREVGGIPGSLDPPCHGLDLTLILWSLCVHPGVKLGVRGGGFVRWRLGHHRGNEMGCAVVAAPGQSPWAEEEELGKRRRWGKALRLTSRVMGLLTHPDVSSRALLESREWGREVRWGVVGLATLCPGFLHQEWPQPVLAGHQLGCGEEKGGGERGPGFSTGGRLSSPPPRAPSCPACALSRATSEVPYFDLCGCLSAAVVLWAP